MHRFFVNFFVRRVRKDVKHDDASLDARQWFLKGPPVTTFLFSSKKSNLFFLSNVMGLCPDYILYTHQLRKSEGLWQMISVQNLKRTSCVVSATYYGSIFLHLCFHFAHPHQTHIFSSHLFISSLMYVWTEYLPFKVGSSVRDAGISYYFDSHFCIDQPQ